MAPVLPGYFPGFIIAAMGSGGKANRGGPAGDAAAGPNGK